MLKTLKLAGKFLWREWRAGEWTVIFIALVLAITATTSIHFYTDRLTRGLDQQSARFLGGDLVISSPVPIAMAVRQKAEALHLRTSDVWAYPSVVSANNQLQLVNLQAVADNYPLLGDSNNHPGLGDVWVEPRLLPLLTLKLHEQLTIGAAQFHVSRVLTSDVDSLNTGWAIAPRLMMRLADVPATRTVLPGSRIDYRLLITGEKKQLQLFRLWLTPQLSSSQHLLDAGNQQLTLHNILQHAEDYMQLVLLSCLLMSGVAIALSMQQYMRRHYGHVALWRCLGARQEQIRLIIFWQLTMIAVSAALIAIVLGYVAQSVFANLFKELLKISLPPAGIMPAVFGLMTSILLLFAFAFPAIWELPGIAPVYLWRNQIRSIHKNFYLLFAFLIVSLFVYCCMDFSLLTLYFLAGLMLSIALLYGISLFLIWLLRKLVVKTDGAVRRGLNQLLQYSDSVSLQFIGFNLLLIALCVLGGVRNYLLADWQQALPPKTPNYFAFNIAPTDLNNLNAFFQAQHISVEGVYPMVRGRVIEVNKQPIMNVVPESGRNNNALHRELNLSFMWKFPSDNKLVQGHVWTSQDAGKALVSVENKLAKDLNLHLGDELTFQIGDKQASAVIDSFRSLDWSSFHPNFFMIFPPGFLQDYPLTYITSFHLTPGQGSILNQLVQTFPNITVIDIATLLQQMQDLISKITLAMQYLFLFALGDGILIFVTCLQASMDERKQTYRLLRVLGAGRRFIRNAIVVEFSSLVAMILLFACGISVAVIILLEKFIFK